MTAAIALWRAGCDVRVFEQAAELNEVGAGITLWSNATVVLARLGVLERLRELGHRARGGMIGTDRGKIISRLDPHGPGKDLAMPEILAIHRAELQQTLFDALPGTTVTLAARCTGFDQDDSGVTAHFADRADERGALLIGADGIHSVIRAQLWGDEAPRYAGYTCWRGITAPAADVAGHSGEIWGRGQRFGIVPIGGQRIYWYATANAKRGNSDPPGARKKRLLQRFAGWQFQVPEIIESTPDTAILHNDILDRPPRTTWTRGRVTLVGDAAHATTPNLGQGAAMAIEDSIVLARAVTERGDLGAALAAYEAARVERTTMITGLSRRLGRMFQWENPAARWLRDRLFAMTPASIHRRQLDRIARYDASRVALPGPDS